MFNERHFRRPRAGTAGVAGGRRVYPSSSPRERREVGPRGSGQPPTAGLRGEVGENSELGEAD